MTEKYGLLYIPYFGLLRKADGGVDMMQKFVQFVVQCDLALIALVHKAVEFVEERTNISQRRLEKFLLFMVCLTGTYWSPPFSSSWFDLFISLIDVSSVFAMVYILDKQRKYPDDMRTLHIKFALHFRIWFALIMLLSLIGLFIHIMIGFRKTIPYWVFIVVFEYVICLPSSGKRIRRKKPQSSKLKTMVDDLLPGPAPI